MASKEYAIIRTDEYYGPKTTHTMIGMPTDKDHFVRPADERVELSDNQASTSTDVWEIEQTINPSDWNMWPQDLVDAACELLRDFGIDPDDAEAVEKADFDVPTEAAQKIGKCIVSDEKMRDYYLCKPIDW